MNKDTYKIEKEIHESILSGELEAESTKVIHSITDAVGNTTYTIGCSYKIRVPFSDSQTHLYDVTKVIKVYANLKEIEPENYSVESVEITKR